MIELKQLSLAYSSQTVLHDVSSQFEAGKIHGIIGPNGCGKSTLLKALAGLKTASSGQVLVNDLALERWSRKKLATQLAVLPQQPTAPQGLTVRQLVHHGRYAHQGLLQRSSEQDRVAIDWALAVTDMTALQHRVFASLSGGERQRGWLALSLAQQPKILLLDEPTTFLDIGHQFQLLELLKYLNRQHGLTIIMVLHDINQASQYADVIRVLHQGDLLIEGAPSQVITPELIRQVFDVEVEQTIRGEGKDAFPFFLPLGSTKYNTEYFYQNQLGAQVDRRIELAK